MKTYSKNLVQIQTRQSGSESEKAERVTINYDAKGPKDYLQAVPLMKYPGFPDDDWEKYEYCLYHADLIAEEIKEKPKTVLLFLSETIFILSETGRKFIDKPDHIENLIYRYWEAYSANAGIDPDLAIAVCERYLELCESDANQDWFERNNLHREDQIREISEKLLLLRYLDGTNPNENDKGRIEQLLNRARRWLILRYNLEEARKITYHKRPGRRFLASWLPEISALLILAVCFFLKIKASIFHGLQGDTDKGFCLLAWLRHTWTYLLDQCPFVPWERLPIIFFYISAGVIVALLASPLLRRTGEPPVDTERPGVGVALLASPLLRRTDSWPKPDLQLHLPRLAAAILVGYMLLLNDEAWQGILWLHAWPFFGGILIPIVAVALYILIEMNNVSGIGIKYAIWRKALRLLFRGASYAVLFGIIISDLVGESIVARLVKANSEKPEPEFLPGCFGNVYPEVLCLLAPMALFIGVFIQVLWEDKTLTEKI